MSLKSQKSSLVIFASGNGTNAEAIMHHFRNHDAVAVALVLCNKRGAGVLDRARKFDVPAWVFGKEELQNPYGVLRKLNEVGATHLVLAGFLWLVPGFLIRAYDGRIINIHPALLPHFGGKGMYGSHIHEAVKKSGDKETGITIHLVNEKFDDGKILFQARCPVELTDSPETIAEKVHQLEHQHYPAVVEKWIAANP